MKLATELGILEHAHMLRRTSEAEPTYIFNHTLLQEAAYASLLQRTRRDVHLQIAQIYEQIFAEQLDDQAALIAHHFDRAGALEKAVTYLIRAGAYALLLGSFQEAISAYTRALELEPEDNAEKRAALFVRLSNVYEKKSEFATAIEHLQTGLALARRVGDLRTTAEALSGLCWVDVRQGAYEQARRAGEEALTLALQINDLASTALAHRRLGIVSAYEGNNAAAVEHLKSSLALYRELDDSEGVAGCLNNLGIVVRRQGDYTSARAFHDESLSLARQIDNRQAIGMYLGNLGELARSQGDHDAAIRYIEEALVVLREIDARDLIATSTLTLGDIASAQGDDLTASRHYREGLSEAYSIGALPLALYALGGLAGVMQRAGAYSQAAEISGLLSNNPANEPQIKNQIAPIIDALRASMPRAEWEEAVERGKKLKLEVFVRKIKGEF